MTTELNEPKRKKDGSKSRPEHVIREGGVAAMIWRRVSPTGFPYYEFTLSRSWKTFSSGKVGYSSHFFSTNEAQLKTVVEQACKWIAEHGTQLHKEPLAA